MPSMLPLLYTSEKREISDRHLEADTSAEVHRPNKELSVHWVAHRRETQPVAIERTALQGLDKLVEMCQGRFPEMKRTYPDTPPDGFLVFDADGIEVRRWFDSVRPKE
jgi:hypothetical protein